MFRSIIMLVCFGIGCAAGGCGPAPTATVDARPDASRIPTSAAGTFAVTSQLDLASIPPPAQAILDELAAATDGPDDPGRYLVDRIVAAMPDGVWKTIAAGLAPYIAPYVQAELTHLAPKLAPGLRAIVQDLGAIARHITTAETFTIARDDITTRTIAGVQLGSAAISLRDEGLADASAVTRTALVRDELAIAEHRIALPYGRMLRIGLDRAVLPKIDVAASNLADVLRDLVDCHALGIVFAEHVGGWPGLYETACAAGMTTIANDIYARLAAIDATPFTLTMTGAATAIDLDGNGSLDAIAAGTWTGGTAYGALGAASFTGATTGATSR
jgi:hypothetical protein